MAKSAQSVRYRYNIEGPLFEKPCFFKWTLLKLKTVGEYYKIRRLFLAVNNSLNRNYRPTL
jgi:hypothetical protein